jgi:serine/threonine protein kinase
MEYLEGRRSPRESAAARPLDEALKVAIMIADALEKAHGHGVTHRDLKPGNIMLTEGGAAADFGCSRSSGPRLAVRLADYSGRLEHHGPRHRARHDAYGAGG